MPLIPALWAIVIAVLAPLKSFLIYIFSKGIKQVAVIAALTAGMMFLLTTAISQLLGFASVNLTPPAIVLSAWGHFMPTNATVVISTYISATVLTFVTKIGLKYKSDVARILGS